MGSELWGWRVGDSNWIGVTAICSWYSGDIAPCGYSMSRKWPEECLTATIGVSVGMAARHGRTGA